MLADWLHPRLWLAVTIIALASFFLWHHSIDGGVWSAACLTASGIFSTHQAVDDKLPDRVPG